MDTGQAVVIDNGSDTIKAGFAFDDAPRAVLHSVIGRPRAQGLLIGVDAGDVFTGQEALHKQGVLRMHSPIVRGRIENFQYAEMLWYDCFFAKLKTCPFSPCLMTMCPLASEETKQRVAEIMFDTFLAPCLYLAAAPLLSVLAAGKTSGLGVEVGEGYASVMPVVEGFALKHGIEKQEFAGQDLDQVVSAFLQKKQAVLPAGRERECVRLVKAQSESAVGSEAESPKLGVKEMTLPDGCRLTLEPADQLACSEALFNPRAHGFEKQGLHELVLQAVGKIESEHKKELLGNMVMSGGSSAIPRLGARLESEIESISQSLSNVKKVVFEHSQRQYLSWVGGSLLCSLQSFQTMWITRPEFEEHGPSIVLKKCY